MGFEPHRFRRLHRLRAGSVVVPVATGFRSRLLGLALLGRERAGPGLLIPHCRSVHTLGMRFPIDILIAARDGRVVKVRADVPARRIVGALRGFAVIEMAANELRRADVRAGDRLLVEA